MQVKLLRVIQEKTVRPVGAGDVKSRSTCASCRRRTRTSRELVAEGSFREDLFYRINVIGVHVPPLRERGGGRADARGVASCAGSAGDMKVTTPQLTREALAACSPISSPATCASSRTSSSARSRCGRAARSDVGRHAAAADDRKRGAAAGRRLTARRSATISRTSSATRSSRRSNRRATTRPRPRRCLGITFRALRYRIKKLGIE